MAVTYDSYSKTWRGPLFTYLHGKSSFGEVVFNLFKENPSDICQISADSDEIYTRQRMLNEAMSFATALRNQGIKKCDNVLFLLDNHHYMASTYLGTILAGAVICPFIFAVDFIKVEIKDLIEQIQPKLMITSYVEWIDEFQNIFEKLQINCPIYVYGNERHDCYDLKPLLENDVDINTFVPESVDDPATETLVLTLSSATTGKTKIIINTHLQFLSSFADSPSGTRQMSLTKPGWITETLGLFWSFLTLNARVITSKTLTAVEFFQIVEKHQINTVFVKPKDIFEALQSEIVKKLDLSCLQICASTGNHLSQKVKEDFEKLLTKGVVCPVYGMSDLPGGVTGPTIEKCFPGSVGKIRKGAAVRIADENENFVGPNEVGEIYLKSFAPFVGYYKNDELTQKSQSSDGFFKTEDMGYVDMDGNVFLVDRKKYFICYRGGWINQSKIESIVLDYVDGVNGVCCVDIEDDANGVIPVIAIIPRQGVTLNEQQIKDIVNARHDFHIEMRVFFFKNLPITVSGKYRKHLVREMVQNTMKKNVLN